MYCINIYFNLFIIYNIGLTDEEIRLALSRVETQLARVSVNDSSLAYGNEQGLNIYKIININKYIKEPIEYKSFNSQTVGVTMQMQWY
jgi:hypothetical protein